MKPQDFNRVPPEASLDFRKKRNTSSNRNCPFMMAGWKDVDYKDVETLKRFITERGKVLPRRITGVSSRFQRFLSEAIKKARYIGLLPFVSED